MIVIIDYGMGNIGSIRNMLKKVGANTIVSGRPEDIETADKLILPGVGAFGHCMEDLKDSDLIEILTQRVLRDRCPILGICVGMQLMTERSDEGNVAGLGWVEAEVRKFHFEGDVKQKLRIPHMGWNIVRPKENTGLFTNVEGEQRYYFVHSYYVDCRDKRLTTATTTYGIEFDCAFEKDNILGVQFHPEKSHKFGMNLLRNYAGDLQHK